MDLVLLLISYFKDFHSRQVLISKKSWEYCYNSEAIAEYLIPTHKNADALL
jgi:hypothetical protein